MYLRPLIVIISISVALAAFFNRNLLFQSDANATTERQNTDNKPSLTVKVITQPVVETNSSKMFETIGTGKARLSVNLYPQVIGEVTSVNFKAQHKVKAGEVLVDLDNREQKLAVRLAEVEIKGAKNLLARYEQALLDGALDVESTLVALQTSIDRQSSLEKAVTSSSRSFEQANRLYQLGLSSFLDVVDAQRVLASAEQQLATERTNYSTQIASLFRVLGTSVAY